MAKYSIITPPATEPVTVAEAKEHCFVESSNTDWDTYFSTLIQAAREYAERYLGRALMPQTIIDYYDCFPSVTDQNPYGGIELRWTPVASVTSVKYLDGDGNEQTYSISNYKTDLVAEPAFVMPAYSTNWPTNRDEVNSVYVEYVAGYADADTVPQAIKQAMLLAIKETFDCRDNTVKRFPTKAEHLLNFWRLHTI